MARRNSDDDTSVKDVAKLAKRILYGIVAFDAVLFIAYFNELPP